jgi:hypothetical protein
LLKKRNLSREENSQENRKKPRIKWGHRGKSISKEEMVNCF